MRLSKKTIRRLQERFFHGAAKDQVPEARKNLPHIELEQREIEERATEVRRDWQEEEERCEGSPLTRESGSDGSEPPEPFERAEYKHRAALLRWSGAAALLLDSLLTAYGSKEWANATPQVAALIGIFLAAVFSFLARPAWGIGPQDHSNPTPEIKRREILLWKLGLFNLLLLGVLFLIRFIPLPEYAYLIPLAMLSISLPLFAAGAEVLGRLLSTRNRLAAEYRRLRSFSRDLQLLIDRMKEILSPPPPQAASSILLAILLSTLFLLARPAFLEARTVQLWLDTSGSLDQSIISPAYRDLAEIVVGAGGVDRIEIYGFANAVDALRMPRSVFALPQVRQADSCQGKSSGGFLKPAEKWRAAKCHEEQAGIARERTKTLVPVPARLASQLEALAHQRPSRSSCVLQTLLRCALQKPGTASIVITDGAQEFCPVPARPSALGGAEVIVLLVPKQGDNEQAVKLLEERSLRIRAFLPRVVVVPLFRLTSDLPGLLKN